MKRLSEKDGKQWKLYISELQRKQTQTSLQPHTHTHTQNAFFLSPPFRLLHFDSVLVVWNLAVESILSETKWSFTPAACERLQFSLRAPRRAPATPWKAPEPAHCVCVTGVKCRQGGALHSRNRFEKRQPPYWSASYCIYLQTPASSNPEPWTCVFFLTLNVSVGKCCPAASHSFTQTCYGLIKAAAEASGPFWLRYYGLERDFSAAVRGWRSSPHIHSEARRL